jgi:hypothetical protein
LVERQRDSAVTQSKAAIGPTEKRIFHLDSL